MKKLYVFMTAVGAIAFIWFALPVITAGIVNIGNLTGLILSVCLVFYAVKADKVKKYISALRQKKVGKAFLIVASILVLCIAMLASLLTFLMVNETFNKPTGEETAVVLGCRVYGERASLLLRERLDAAYEYLTEYPEAVCIVSGGQGDDEDISEAECMYRYLTEKGISPDRIFKEDKSTSTRENMIFSKEIIEKNGLPQKIAVVTNEFHIYRACRIAEKLGFECVAVCGKTAFWLFPTYYVREMYGILYEWIM